MIKGRFKTCQRFKSVLNDPAVAFPDVFLNPSLSISNLDRFYIRSSILNALLSQKKHLKGILLDVGCGQMPYKRLLVAPQGNATRYIGLDLDNNPIHDNQPDICWENSSIPLENDTVDCALCTEVLEHCPDPVAVLREVSRVLKPGGMLFFTAPFLWPLHEVPYDYYRYTPFALRHHLQNSGFYQIELHATGGWDASLAQMLGLWVRRRPMGRLPKTLLSGLVYPFYWWLVRRDRLVRVRFEEQDMLTGLWGTAVKQVRPEGLKRSPSDEESHHA